MNFLTLDEALARLSQSPHAEWQETGAQVLQAAVAEWKKAGQKSLKPSPFGPRFLTKAADDSPKPDKPPEPPKQPKPITQPPPAQTTTTGAAPQPAAPTPPPENPASDPPDGLPDIDFDQLAEEVENEVGGPVVEYRERRQASLDDILTALPEAPPRAFATFNIISQPRVLEPIQQAPMYGAFLEDIAETPEDPVRLLIFADWLEEQGADGPAQNIRVWTTLDEQARRSLADWENQLPRGEGYWAMLRAYEKIPNDNEIKRLYVLQLDTMFRELYPVEPSNLPFQWAPGWSLERYQSEMDRLLHATKLVFLGISRTGEWGRIDKDLTRLQQALHQSLNTSMEYRGIDFDTVLNDVLMDPFYYRLWERRTVLDNILHGRDIFREGGRYPNSMAIAYLGMNYDDNEPVALERIDRMNSLAASYAAGILSAAASPGQKSLPNYHTKATQTTPRFTGSTQDAAGRKLCLQGGKHVPCEDFGGEGQGWEGIHQQEHSSPQEQSQGQEQGQAQPPTPQNPTLGAEPPTHPMPPPTPQAVVKPSPFGGVQQFHWNKGYIKSGPPPQIPLGPKIQAPKPPTASSSANLPRPQHPPIATPLAPPAQSQAPPNQHQILEQVKRAGQQHAKDTKNNPGTNIAHWLRSHPVNMAQVTQFEAAGVRDVNTLEQVLNKQTPIQGGINLLEFHDDASPFVLLSQPQETLIQGGTPAVVVGEPYLAQTQLLEEAFPGIHFLKVEELPNELGKAAGIMEKPLPRKSISPSPFGFPHYRVKSDEPPKPPKTPEPTIEEPHSTTSPTPTNPAPYQPQKPIQVQASPPPEKGQPPKREDRKQADKTDSGETSGEKTATEEQKHTPVSIKPGSKEWVLRRMRQDAESGILPDPENFDRYTDYMVAVRVHYIELDDSLMIDTDTRIETLYLEAMRMWEEANEKKQTKIRESAKQYREDPIHPEKTIDYRIQNYQRGKELHNYIVNTLTPDLTAELYLELRDMITRETGHVTDTPDADLPLEMSGEAYAEAYQKVMINGVHAYLAQKIGTNAKWTVQASLDIISDNRYERALEAQNFFRSLVSYGDRGHEDGGDVPILHIRDGDKSRSYYDGDVRLTYFANTATIVHEIGHHLEHHVPGVAKAAQAFLRYRTQGEPFVRIQDILPKGGYEKDEIGYEDKFSKHFGKLGVYAGKLYGTRSRMRATEIVSMGLQALYEDPLGFATNDPEYFNFIIGICTGELRYS